MTLTVESVCRGAREYIRRTGQTKQLKFSALNDAVSKALSGLPYAQAVAAERAGKPHRLNICPAATATIAAIYGIDAYDFHVAIGLGALRSTTSEESRGLKFWPFPERERVMAQLIELMEAPINGRHVILAAHDVTAGTSTTISELMHRKAPTDASPYLLLNRHSPPSLADLARGALIDILDPPMEEWSDLPIGKAAIAAVKNAAAEAGLVRLLFDEFSSPLRYLHDDWRAPHYLRGLERLVLESPVKALFECSRWRSRMAKAMPELWANADVVMLDPISDSPALRAWLAASDPTQCMGEYDDEMVTGLLGVTEGNMLLMHRYVRDAVTAVLLHGQVKDVVRKRVRSLADIDPEKSHCWAVSSLITGQDQER